MLPQIRDYPLFHLLFIYFYASFAPEITIFVETVGWGQEAQLSWETEEESIVTTVHVTTMLSYPDPVEEHHWFPEVKLTFLKKIELLDPSRIIILFFFVIDE